MKGPSRASWLENSAQAGAFPGLGSIDRLRGKGRSRRVARNLLEDPLGFLNFRVGQLERQGAIEFRLGRGRLLEVIVAQAGIVERLGVAVIAAKDVQKIARGARVVAFPV